MPDVLPGYQEALTSGAIFALEGWSVLRLTGDDARTWLQGQITQDISSSSKEAGWAWMTSPKGRAEALLCLCDQAGSILILTQQPDVVRERVEEMVILEDVALADAGLHAWVGMGSSLPPVSNFFQLAIRKAVQDGLIFPSSFTSQNETLILIESEQEPIYPADALHILMLEAGIPLFGVDTGERTLPPEMGSRFDGLSTAYDKGCYVGQEVLMRIHSRGHVNQRWVCLSLEQAVGQGDPVMLNGKQAGQVTRCHWSPNHGWIAGAIVRTEAENGDGVMVGDLAATVHDHPVQK